MRKLLASLIVLPFALSVTAETLFWQVSQHDWDNDTHLSSLGSGTYMAVLRYGDIENENLGSWTIAMDEYRSAAIKDGTGDDWEAVFPSFYGGDMWAVGGEHDDFSSVAPAAVDISAIASDKLAFYVEVWRYNETKHFYEGVARSEVEMYSNLSKYVAAEWEEGMTAEVWHGSGYSIPEPTSAMLMMIGLSLVGLKRKRA